VIPFPGSADRKVEQVADKVLEDPGEDLVASAKRDRAERRGPFARLALFIRQVINELKKVVTPTRRELFSYTGVVLAFVIVMMALVYALDFASSFLVAWVFGDGTVG